MIAKKNAVSNVSSRSEKLLNEINNWYTIVSEKINESKTLIIL